MTNYLVTGSSRGLGLALVSRLASLSTSDVGTVIATSRQGNSPRLHEVTNSSSGRVGFVPMDVTNAQSIQDAVELVENRLKERGLDVLINNAGVMPVTKEGLEAMYLYHIQETFQQIDTNFIQEQPERHFQHQRDRRPPSHQGVPPPPATGEEKDSRQHVRPLYTSKYTLTKLMKAQQPSAPWASPPPFNPCPSRPTKSARRP